VSIEPIDDFLFYSISIGHLIGKRERERRNCTYIYIFEKEEKKTFPPLVYH